MISEKNMIDIDQHYDFSFYYNKTSHNQIWFTVNLPFRYRTAYTSHSVMTDESRDSNLNSSACSYPNTLLTWPNRGSSKRLGVSDSISLSASETEGERWPGRPLCPGWPRRVPATCAAGSASSRDPGPCHVTGNRRVKPSSRGRVALGVMNVVLTEEMRSRQACTFLLHHFLQNL